MARAVASEIPGRNALTVLSEPVNKNQNEVEAKNKFNSRIICAGAFDPFKYEIVGNGVSSITDTGVGDYFVSFLEPIEAEYFVQITADNLLASCTNQTSKGFGIKLLQLDDKKSTDGIVKFLCFSIE
ncbi:MAG: hypothetical protein O3A78_04630 [Nitrospinae bacterium]|nr:hypothetical protein [Nitrospinota bacterium]